MLNLLLILFAMFWALAASREPIRVRTPAFANRMATALPSLPVPPIMASDGLGLTIVDILVPLCWSTSLMCVYIFYGSAKSQRNIVFCRSPLFSFIIFPPFQRLARGLGEDCNF
jgi:hypothetical protein